MVSLPDDMHTDASCADGMPLLENTVVSGERRRGAPANGRTEGRPEEERLTETQWVSRWIGEGSNITLMCEEESAYRAKQGDLSSS